MKTTLILLLLVVFVALVMAGPMETPPDIPKQDQNDQDDQNVLGEFYRISLWIDYIKLGVIVCFVSFCNKYYSVIIGH